jgi:hypothetical protein
VHVLNWTGLVYASALSVVVSLPTFGVVDRGVGADAKPQPWVGPADGPNVVQTPVAALGEFVCGRGLPAGLNPEVDGVRVRVVRVTTGRHGAPRVTYRLTAARPVSLSPGFARVVVLDPAGLILAGQDHAVRYADMADHRQDADLAVRTVSPGHPLVRRLPPTNTRPCPGTTWRQLLRRGNSLAVVAEDWSLAQRPAGDALIDRAEILTGPHA